MSNLAQRVLAAVIGVPLILGLVYMGGAPFLIFIALLVAMGLVEFIRLKKPTMPLLLQTVYLFLGLSVFFFLSNPAVPARRFFLPGLVAGFFLFVFIEVVRQKVSSSAGHAAWAALGIFYVALLGSFVYRLRMPLEEMDATPKWLYLLFANVWVSDTVAYFAGKAWGKTKIRPIISPKKTVAGCVAGLAGSLVVVGAFWVIAVGPLSVPKAAVLGLLLGTMGQVGDFWESIVKRYAAIKDSSSLIPGHGGVLDRFDSLFFTAPVLFYFLTFWGIS